MVDVFRNKPLETARNLIVIGSEDTNTIAKHLGAVDTFTYDKVLEKVTNGYPGPGRGVIQVVESINDCAYDATDTSKEAILIGGSDKDGTMKAIDEFCKILQR